jgi:hypothetical protein
MHTEFRLLFGCIDTAYHSCNALMLYKKRYTLQVASSAPDVSDVHVDGSTAETIGDIS